MKLFLTLFFATSLSGAVFASQLVEFDSRDFKIGQPNVEGKSLVITLLNGTKISDGVYKDRGGCSGCTFLRLDALYVISIPLEASLTIQFHDYTIVWHEPTQGERVYTIPPERLNIKIDDAIVLDRIAGDVQSSLDYLSDVRRGTVFFDQKTNTCYINGIRGTYDSETLRITSFVKNKFLSKCP